MFVDSLCMVAAATVGFFVGPTLAAHKREKIMEESFGRIAATTVRICCTALCVVWIAG